MIEIALLFPSIDGRKKDGSLSRLQNNDHASIFQLTIPNHTGKSL